MSEGNGVTTGTPADVLDAEQKARGQALIIARDILAQKGTGPFASVSLNGSSVWDLISAAEYVLTGATLATSYLDGESEDSEGEVADPTTESEVDPAILQFATSTEARAYQDLFAQSGLGTYNSQIGFMHGWAAARGYFDWPTNDQAIADGPDDGDGADDGVH